MGAARARQNGNSYQFTGRENDGTGLYFHRARYYSPTFQRFIAQDPIGFAGGNPNIYAYVLNNPVLLSDSLGLLVLYVSTGRASATGSTGTTSSQGGYVDASPGLGTFETNGSLQGADAGGSVSGGVYSGDITGFQGPAEVLSASVSIPGIELGADFSVSWNDGGWGISVGAGFVLPIGFSRGNTYTNVFPWYGPDSGRGAGPAQPEFTFDGPEFRRPCP